MANDTIAAPATASGRSGVAIVRVSGPRAVPIGLRICGSLGQPREMVLRRFRTRSGNTIDEGLVAVFPKEGSFTGEDVVEFFPHGSDAVVRKLLLEITATEEARLAQPGEFTRRAFENGRLDLSQVEGLAGLIDSETEAQRKQALALLEGALSRPLRDVRAALLKASALIEASIDFADEDLPDGLQSEALNAIGACEAPIERMVSGANAARKIKEGLTIAILGPPNAGKSSFLNYIAQDDVAIVTEIAGTTRDALSVRVALGELMVTFVDTAGLRETEDEIEREGVKRARAIAESADVRLFLSEDRVGGIAHDLPVDFYILTKKDITGVDSAISTKTGEGMDVLLDQVLELVREKVEGASLVASLRQEALLQMSLDEIAKARESIHRGAGADISAEHLRRAIRSLDEVVGSIGVEDVLSEIFSAFCIGK